MDLSWWVVDPNLVWSLVYGYHKNMGQHVEVMSSIVGYADALQSGNNLAGVLSGHAGYVGTGVG